MAKPTTRNPCVGICKFRQAVCTGCLRTRDEVKAWRRLPEEERAAIAARVLPLMGGKRGKAERRREKLEKKRARLQAKLRKVDLKLAGLGAKGDAAASTAGPR